MDGELLAVLKWTAVYTGFTFLCTAAGAAAVFFLKPDAKTELAETLSLGFAAGIMTAASVWSLIIPAQEMAQKQGDTPWLIASLGIAAGAGFLKLLDAVLPHLHPGASKPEGPKTKMHRAMLLFLAITLHNIPEGVTSGFSPMNFERAPIKRTAARLHVLPSTGIRILIFTPLRSFVSLKLHYLLLTVSAPGASDRSSSLLFRVYQC
mgnify:CR=1 FL=1